LSEAGILRTLLFTAHNTILHIFLKSCKNHHKSYQSNLQNMENPISTDLRLCWCTQTFSYFHCAKTAL